MSTTPGVEAAPPHVPVPAPGSAPASDSAPAPVSAPVPVPSHRTAARLPFAFERGLTGPGIPSPLAGQRVWFTAPSPCCGLDIEWLQVREDTRTRSIIRCACEPGSEQAELLP